MELAWTFGKLQLAEALWVESSRSGPDAAGVLQEHAGLLYAHVDRRFSRDQPGYDYRRVADGPGGRPGLAERFAVTRGEPGVVLGPSAEFIGQIYSSIELPPPSPEVHKAYDTWRRAVWHQREYTPGLPGRAIHMDDRVRQARGEALAASAEHARVAYELQARLAGHEAASAGDTAYRSALASAAERQQIRLEAVRQQAVEQGRASEGLRRLATGYVPLSAATGRRTAQYERPGGEAAGLRRRFGGPL